MNSFDDSHNSGVSAPKSDDAEQLYQKLTSELGIKTKSPTQRRVYHRKSAFQFIFLPKAAWIMIIGSIVTLIILFLTFPAKMSDLSFTPSGNLMDVSFTVHPYPLLDGVIARLNDRPVAVTKERNHYTVHADKNGDLVVTVETLMGRTTTVTFTIDSIDDQPPSIVNHFNDNGTIYIFLTDDSSGIDWENITATDTNSGASVPLAGYSADKGYVSLSFPGGPITLLVPDCSGNALTAILEPVQ